MPSFVDIFITENAEKLKTNNGRERLSLLAQFLKLVPRFRFRLEGWSDWDFNSDSCNTSACACGWATLIFQEFKLEKLPYATNLKYSDDIGWFAVESFFDLTQTHSYYLFSMYSYNDDPTPTDVAERIEKFLEESSS